MAYSLGLTLAAGLGVAAGVLFFGTAHPTPAEARGPAADAPLQLAQADTDTAPVLPGAPLPNGASSLQEGYQDWQVVCTTGEAGRQCAMLQQQNDPETNQRVLALELTAQGESTAGTLVLPFGLDLAHGVALQIDDQAPLEPARFSTCLPAGCLVPLTLDEGTLTALRAGQTLQVRVRAQDAQDLSFPVSLKGFAQALDRIGTLK